MANDVRIGVSAETKGVETGFDKTDRSVKRVTKTVEDLGRAARKTASEIDRIEVSARRLEQVQKILQAELGRSVSPGEARAFLDRFEAMRQNRHLTGGSKLRQFGTFEEWHREHRNLFLNPADANRHRRHVLGMASGGVPLAPGHSPPGSGGLMQSGMSSIMRFGGGMLALSGIMGVTAMAGRAVSMARQEADANDKLLRSVGDLNTTFDVLRSQVRSSVEDLGISFVEAGEMARQFVKEANADAGTDIGGNLRTGAGMARAFGFDERVGVGFLAQMRHYGVTGSNDPTGKRLALNIAEAIERGNVTAKSEEVLQAISNFTTVAARISLGAPNVAGFAGALASLTSSHTPGLNPANAANMLMAADAAIRRGGGGGEAGLNLTYGALSRVNPNLNPMVALAIAEQGAFGSGADLAGTPLGAFLSERGVDLGSLSSKTNLELIRDEIRRQYGDSVLGVDALKTYFELPSYQQAAALYNMSPMQLGGLQGILQRAGLSTESISATGLQNIAEIGVADREKLQSIGARLLGRSDIGASEKENLRRLLSGEDDDALRTEMARLVATREQEGNIGSDLRDSMAGLDSTLTGLGSRFLPVIEGIQSGVVRIADAVAPQDKGTMEIMRGNLDRLADGMPTSLRIPMEVMSRLIPSENAGELTDAGTLPGSGKAGNQAAPSTETAETFSRAVESFRGVIESLMRGGSGQIDPVTGTVRAPLPPGSR